MLSITNYTRFNKFEEIEQLLQWLANKLEISTGEVVLISSSKMLKKFSTEDMAIKAFLAPTVFKDKYNLYLSDTKDCDLDIILCHEMVHLKQYLEKELVIDLEKKEFTWKGNKYDNSIPYESRPWEREAFSLQNKLYKEYKKSLKTEKEKKRLFGFLTKKS